MALKRELHEQSQRQVPKTSVLASREVHVDCTNSKKGMHQLRLHPDGDISLRDVKVQAWVDYKCHGKSGWHTRKSLYQERDSLHQNGDMKGDQRDTICYLTVVIF